MKPESAFLFFAVFAALLTCYYWFQQLKYERESCSSNPDNNDDASNWRDWSENEIEPRPPNTGDGIMDDVMQEKPRPQPGEFIYGPPSSPKLSTTHFVDQYGFIINKNGGHLVHYKEGSL